MKMANDILLEIPDKDLINLRDLFQPYWPYAMHAYYWVDNYIDWKKRGITNMKFYSPDGKWDDGTFISIDDDRDFYTVFLFTLDKTCNRLKNALAETNVLKWNKNKFFMFFSAVHEDQQTVLMNELKKRQIDILHQDISNMWWISKEDALKYQYEIPSEVYLAQLKEKDVDKIDSVWPHRSKSSKIYLKNLIIYNGGFGLYCKNTYKLCSWIMRNNYGGMAILQTDDEYKRKGYGKILAQHFSKHWAEKGLDIFCFIMVHNKPSLALFEKLGWKKEHGITWTHCITK